MVTLGECFTKLAVTSFTIPALILINSSSHSWFLGIPEVIPLHLNRSFIIITSVVPVILGTKTIQRSSLH